MSRIGNMPIEIPSGVTVEVSDQSEVTVKGPKGDLAQRMNARVGIEVAGDTVVITRSTEQKQDKSLHGLTRALIANMVLGVTEGFEKRLEIQGVGYRAEVQGRNLELRLGYSNPVLYEPCEGIEFEVQDNLIVIVRGIDKQKVGQTAGRRYGPCARWSRTRARA